MLPGLKRILRRCGICTWDVDVPKFVDHFYDSLGVQEFGANRTGRESGVYRSSYHRDTILISYPKCIAFCMHGRTMCSLFLIGDPNLPPIAIRFGWLRFIRAVRFT
jgi:hypothetical protein